LTLLLASGAGAATEAYVVVANDDVPVQDLSLDEVRRVFLLQRAFWKPGKPVRVVLPATGQPGRAFLLEKVCRRSESDLRRRIMEAVYSGETDQAPRMAGSDLEALNLVAASTGAVALVTAESSLPDGTRLLRVGGKLPSDPGYELGVAPAPVH
jgi:hypothetical protein